LDVHWYVDQDWASAARNRGIKGAIEILPNRVRVEHVESCLRNWPRDTYNVSFLETELANWALPLHLIAVHLTGNEYSGRVVEIAASEWSQKIGRPRSARAHCYSGYACQAGMAFCGEACTLLVMH
jgi:hypothetical protein